MQLSRSSDLALRALMRLAVADERGATIGVGGGITALSVPEEELDEVEQDVSHRAARLYRFDHKKYKQLEKAGFNFEL